MYGDSNAVEVEWSTPPQGEDALMLMERAVASRDPLALAIAGYLAAYKGRSFDKNRRNINADEKLKDVFGGKKQVSMFEMTKLVNKHLK